MAREVESTRNVIVVGVDMHRTGVFALCEGLRLASRLPGAELHAVHVIDVPRDLHDARKIDWLSQEVDAARGRLRHHVTTVASLEGQPGFDGDVILHVRLGKAAEAILQVAVDVEADLVVVGTHARSGVMRWVVGSVAEELLRIARCPVVVAHPKHYEGLLKSPSVEPPRPGQELSDGSSEYLGLAVRERISHIAGLI